MPSRILKSVQKTGSSKSVQCELNARDDADHCETNDNVTDDDEAMEGGSSRTQPPKEQLSQEPGQERRVEVVLQNQLSIANMNLQGKTLRNTFGDERIELLRLRKDLKIQSAKSIPPALACFEGLGTAPFHLFKSITFDKLHVFDLGIIRDIQDFAALTISRSRPCYFTAPQIAAIANQRMKDIPKTAKFKRDSLFRSNFSESQYSIPGKTRRQQCPFIWVCLMGLNQSVDPDQDELLEAAMCLSKVQVELNLINKPSSSLHRTAANIDMLQKEGFKLGILYQSATGNNVSTKLHRIMRHIQNQLYNFGCTRIGYTDENEQMHKVTKKGYRSTDHKRLKLAPQLLQSRICVEMANESPDQFSPSETQLLLSQRTAFRNEDEENTCKISGEQNCEEVPTEELFPGPILRKMQQIVNCERDPMRLENGLLQMRHPTTMSLLWTKIKSKKILRKLSWLTQQGVQKDVLYATDDFRGFKRHDFVEYNNEEETHYGRLQALLQRNDYPTVSIALIRRLKEVKPQQGNTKVVELYGHRRFAYSHFESTPYEPGDVMLDVILTEHIQRPVVMVYDPYHTTKRLGPNYRSEKIPDTLSERRQCKFFLVVDYQQSCVK